MISSLFILNEQGDVTIEKHWRGLLSRSVIDYFLAEIRKEPNPNEVNPIIVAPKSYIVNVHRSDLWFLAVVEMETMPVLVLDWLHRVADVFDEYFGLSEARLKDNFVTAYELLEEMMDNGMPFTTEPNILKELIAPPTLAGKFVSGLTGKSQVSAEMPGTALGNVRWRKSHVKYSTNEIFFDIIEEIDGIIDVNGLMSHSEVSGRIEVNCRLSGMPDLVLKFNNPRIMDDCSFHPCVRFQRWEMEKVLSFVPPDGKFKLMDFRVKGQIQLPLYIKPTIRYSETGASVHVMVGAKLGGTTTKPPEDIVVYIPFPKTVSSSTLSANYGVVQFDDATKICKWRIGRLPGSALNPILEGSVSLQTGATPPDKNPVLSCDFTSMLHTPTGLKVESLTCSESYKPFKGVRNITKAGKLQIRS